jgi:hypothetical protein
MDVDVHVESEMSDREKVRRERQRQASFTVREWCEFRRISPAMFYKLDGQGLAPKSHYVGARRLISGEADEEWLRERESESANNAA